MSQGSFDTWCFGEALWDCTPRGLFLGGASLNVAYHLNQLGLSSLLISAIGNDFLGDEIIRQMQLRKLATSGVARIEKRLTGASLVHLDSNNEPSYEILDHVAWDYIAKPSALSAPRTVTLSGLALRHPENAKTLNSILDLYQPKFVFDLNLRPPFDALEPLIPFMHRASTLKLNVDELRRFYPGSTAEQGARQLAQAYPNARILITAGAEGSGLLDSGQWYWEAALATQVKDTVGAGDSFLAAMLSCEESDYSPADSLRYANRLAAFVASQEGPTPAYDKHALADTCA